MDIIFKGRRTDVQDRFRMHASAKLSKIEKLDHRATRVDVEVSQERNPRLSGRRERVELTVRTRGPVIRAEAAADDRYSALDLALAKLETRVRRYVERRKARRVQHASERADDAALAGALAAGQPGPDAALAVPDDAVPDDAVPEDDVVPIQMEGDGPVVVREKFHQAIPMTVDRALLEMELVGHDFYLFRDQCCGHPSVVYRRHGYQYGLIRLVEDGAGRLPGGG